MATCKERDCLTHKEKSELSMAARMCWVVDLYQMLFIHVCTVHVHLYLLNACMCDV